MRRGFIASGISALQIDDEQAVLEACALDLDVIGERELPLEVAGRDAAMEEVLAFLLAFAAFERQGVLLTRQRDFLGDEPASATEIWKRFSSKPFDVVGRIAFFGSPLDFIENIEKGGRTRWSTSRGKSNRTSYPNPP